MLTESIFVRKYTFRSFSDNSADVLDCGHNLFSDYFYLFMLELNLELVFLLLKDFFFSEATVLYFDSSHPRTSQFPKLLHLELSFLFFVFSSFFSRVMAEHLFQTFSWSKIGHV